MEVNAPEPISMLLFCPRCARQHVDAPEPQSNWENPPHRSHLCITCGYVWRPADVPTTGVAEIQSKGKNDQTASPIPWLLKPCSAEIITLNGLSGAWVEVNRYYDYKGAPNRCPICNSLGTPWAGWFNCEDVAHKSIVDDGRSFIHVERFFILNQSEAREG